MSSARATAAEVGFPLYGVAGDAFDRLVGGWGSGGDERHLELRHLQAGARVSVTNTVHCDPDHGHDLQSYASVTAWASLRTPFPERLAVELRAEPLAVDLDGAPTELWFLGDDDVWVVAGWIGDRHVQVEATGFSLRALELRTLTSLDDYRFPDARTQ